MTLKVWRCGSRADVEVCDNSLAWHDYLTTTPSYFNLTQSNQLISRPNSAGGFTKAGVSSSAVEDLQTVVPSLESSVEHLELLGGAGCPSQKGFTTGSWSTGITRCCYVVIEYP